MSRPASIVSLMKLASQEAIAGRFGEISPEHLLLALLKLAELPLQEIQGMGPGLAGMEQLAKEVQSLRDELAGRGIDSTQVRRRLRAELGRGTRERPTSPMHRSVAARKAFEDAAKLAHEQRVPGITAVHLLRSLLADPTPAMVKVLGKGAGMTACPLLDRCAKDLTQLAQEGKLTPDRGRQAETKALLGSLAANSRPAAFLITDSDDLARDVVIATAAAVSGSTAAPSLKDCRILDVSEACRPDAPGSQADLQGVLDEAAGSSSIILFVPPVVDTSQGPDQWAVVLRSGIEKRQAKIICRVSPDAYAAVLAGDPAWKRLAHPIWLLEHVPDGVPPEL